MKNVSQAVLSLMNLVEAEARFIRRMMLDGFAMMLVMTCAAVAAGGGLTLLLAALHTQLVQSAGRALASVIIAALCFAISGGCVWLVKRWKS